MTTGPKEDSGQVQILLDLDYFLRIPSDIDFDNVLEWLEEAHTHVEETFEGCLKDVLRERFEEVNE